MYPELDDGDTEMRAAPLDWLGAHYLEVPIKRVPLTKIGTQFPRLSQSKESRPRGGFQESYEKGEAFQAAVAAGELTLDDWDKAFNATSKEFYRTRIADIDGILQFLEDFQPVVRGKVRGIRSVVQQAAVDSRRGSAPGELVPAIRSSKPIRTSRSSRVESAEEEAPSKNPRLSLSRKPVELLRRSRSACPREGASERVAGCGACRSRGCHRTSRRGCAILAY